MEARIKALGQRIASLVARLDAAGYVFDRPAEVFPGPAANAECVISRIESSVGPVPAALRLFWTQVGSVDLSGAHPKWPQPDVYLDQLVIFPPDIAAYDLDEYLSGELETFDLVIAPDYFHKAGVSGGAPYAVQMPAAEGDPVLSGTPSSHTFLEHVEEALRWSGFPGLADSEPGVWPLAALIGPEG